MLLKIMVFVGILIFISGFFLLIKNYKNGKYIKGYGLLAYVGISMVLVGTIILMEPIFKSLSKNLSIILPMVIVICSATIARKLLLEPTFLKNKNSAKK